MKDNDSKILARKIDSIEESLDLLIKLTALNISKDEYFKNRERKDEKIEALSGLDIPDKIIALIIGSSVESVQALRSKMKQRKTVKNKDIEFLPEDLQRILSNVALFHSTNELVQFSSEILNINNQFFNVLYTNNESRENIIQLVIRAFQNSDKMKQALFIQALETRATSKELKDTQFQRFLEGWEAHIKG